MTFTHVVDLDYKTRVGDKIWQMSWADEFTEYAKWIEAGEPEGYVFGTDWSLAYPGITIVRAGHEAEEWSERLQRPMYSASIETDRFSIALVYGGIRHRKISEDTGVVRQTVIHL